MYISLKTLQPNRMWCKGSSSHFLFLLFCGCVLNLFPFLGHGQKFEIGLSCFFIWENVVIIFLPPSIRLKKGKTQVYNNNIINIPFISITSNSQSEEISVLSWYPWCPDINATFSSHSNDLLKPPRHVNWLFLHMKHPICNLECLTPSSVWIFLLFLTFCGISFSTLAWDSSSPWSL